MLYKFEERLAAMVGAVLQIDVAPGTELDLQHVPTWDSINHLHLMMDIETEFGVTISDEDALRLTSLGAIRAFLADRGRHVA